MDTLTFSNKSQGWTSRWTYRPEWMIGLNSRFYSFKYGKLYRHDSNQSRTRFYGENAVFSISTIINQSPVETKMFKTLMLDCDVALNVVGSTDMDQMNISASQFSKKEGDFFAYIRRSSGDNNLHFLSAQGLGNVDSVSGLEITMATNISNVSVGDKIIRATLSFNPSTGEYSITTEQEVGLVDNATSNTITVASFTNTPVPGDYLYIVKGAVAESYGARGRYLNLTLGLANSEAETEHELFAVSTSVFKSFP